MAKTPTTTEETPATPVTVVDVDRPVLPAEDYKREQEKSGPDPVSAPVTPSTAAVVDIPANEPYPSGNPNPPPVERVAHNAEKPDWYEPIPPVARGK